jgi:transposase
MEDVLTQVDDPNVILETITSQKTYLSVKRLEKTVEESPPKKQPKTKVPELDRSYKNYSDFTRETFIDRMIEKPEERGLVTKVANDLNINYRTALRWWNSYKETEEIPYKKFEENSGPKSSFTTKHNEHLQGLLDNDPQLFSDDIMKSLTEQFEGFTISKSQLNNHLRNTMLITIKKPLFEPEIRNSPENMETRFEWFMKWKDFNLDFTKNCVFIDEAGFHINMRNNWARSKKGSPAIVKRPKTRAITHTIIGAIHSSSVVHVVMKKPPPSKEKQSISKKRKANSGTKRIVAEVDVEDPEFEDPTDNKPVVKGTTIAHFVKFMNALLDIMDLDENLKENYIVMDNASIHKSKPMIRKIERRGYKVIYLPPYSPELNPIEQFWGVVKGKMKRDRLLAEENLSDRIADACNDVLISDLYGFCNHSKRQIIKCYKKHHSNIYIYIK